MIVKTYRAAAVDNAAIESPELEWQDLGLLLYLESRFDQEIEVTFEGLIDPHRGADADSIRSSLLRLQDAGRILFIPDGNPACSVCQGALTIGEVHHYDGRICNKCAEMAACCYFDWHQGRGLALVKANWGDE